MGQFVDEILRPKAEKRVDSFDWEILPDEPPIVVYYSPLTMGESKEINARSNGDQFDASVMTIIVKARKEDGSKYFDLKDKAFLLDSVEGHRILYCSARLNGQTHRQAENLVRDVMQEDDSDPKD